MADGTPELTELVPGSFGDNLGPEHEELVEGDLYDDVNDYTRAAKDFPISKALADSVSRWPKVPEGKFLLVWRGQPGFQTLPVAPDPIAEAQVQEAYRVARAAAIARKGKLPPPPPKAKTVPFFSTSVDSHVAVGFSNSECCVFEIKVLPGTPFLYITNNEGEGEIFVGTAGQKVHSRRESRKTLTRRNGEKFEDMPVIEVTYGPASYTGARRKTRRKASKRRQKTRRV